MKRLFVKALAVVLMGIALPVLGGTPAQALSTCSTKSVLPELPAMSYVCDYTVSYIVYDSRLHYFVVSSSSAHPVYHIWQVSVGGPFNSSWVSLGGTATSVVKLQNYTNTSTGRLSIEVAVRGSDNSTRYCKHYNDNIAGAWWPGATTWTSSSASCLTF
ncbi:hypothetical protein AB0M47_27765 [Hamadaea sp. NPDC051192]|uniref:hypothetical protein n=1 Tax=Hamadaea sp. NPDC051192 TaxID=3154940 RepID=UPI00341BF660